MIEIVAVADRTATDPPRVAALAIEGGSATSDVAGAAFPQKVNKRVLRWATRSRRAADDLGDALLSDTVAEATSSKSTREDR
jgi:hypothetical protein